MFGTNFRSKFRSYNGTIIFIVSISLIMGLSIIIYEKTKKSFNHELKEDLNLNKIKNYKNLNIVIGLFLLDDFRNLVINYEQDNSYLKNLKECFVILDKNIQKDGRINLENDIKFDNYNFNFEHPIKSPYKEYLQNEKKSREFNIKFFKFENSLEEMFEFREVIKKTEINKKYPNNTFTIEEFLDFSRMCTNSNCYKPIIDDKNNENVIHDIYFPRYFIINIKKNSIFDELKNSKKLSLENCDEIYPYQHNMYKLVSLHVFKNENNWNESKSYIKLKDGKWYGLYSGSEYKQSDINSILCKNEFFYTLFYVKVSNRLKYS